jgi:hypothetical protein
MAGGQVLARLASSIIPTIGLISLLWPRRSPPEMPVIRSLTSTIRHRENHAGSN